MEIVRLEKEHCQEVPVVLRAMKKDSIQLIHFFFRQSDDDTALFYCRNAKCKPPASEAAKLYKQKQGSGKKNL